jgi:prepilin-type N-terminal cleavage/methylation domain-containing protein/prepilin-type processing-associated H-X9-DG protein
MRRRLNYTAFRKPIHGFTLVELLVVISIIALLLSIIMPALGKARESARSLVCKSNLRGINMAASLWSEDNDGWAVGTSWAWPNPIGTIDNPSSLQNYTNSVRGQEKRNIFACPSAKNAGFFGWSTGTPSDDLSSDDAEKQYTYAVNGWISAAFYEGGPGSTASDRGVFGEGPDYVYWYQHGVTKLSRIRGPVETIYFMDHEFYCINSYNFDPSRSPEDVHYQTRWHNRRSGQWYGYSNVAWVDGHVSKEPDDLDEKGANIFSLDRWYYYFWNH